MATGTDIGTPVSTLLLVVCTTMGPCNLGPMVVSLQLPEGKAARSPTSLMSFIFGFNTIVAGMTGTGGLGEGGADALAMADVEVEGHALGQGNLISAVRALGNVTGGGSMTHTSFCVSHRAPLGQLGFVATEAVGAGGFNGSVLAELLLFDDAVGDALAVALLGLLNCLYPKNARTPRTATAVTMPA